MILTDTFAYPGYVHRNGLVYYLESPAARPLVSGFADREAPHALQYNPGYHPRDSVWESCAMLLKYCDHLQPYERLPAHTDRPIPIGLTSNDLLWD